MVQKLDKTNIEQVICDSDENVGGNFKKAEGIWSENGTMLTSGF